MGTLVLQKKDCSREALAFELREHLETLGVKAEPIAALAKTWIEQHPGVTMRQLSVRVAKSARRMGYATSPNTMPCGSIRSAASAASAIIRP